MKHFKKPVWLSRDEGEECAYGLYTAKPEICDGFFLMDNSFIEGFCAEYFERVTGFELEPGECVRVRINVEVV